MSVVLFQGTEHGVQAGSAPVVAITSPADGLRFVAGQTITLQVIRLIRGGTHGLNTERQTSATDDLPLSPSAFQWTVMFRKADGSEEALTLINPGPSGSFVIPVRHVRSHSTHVRS